jgi:hypothetical protein
MNPNKRSIALQWASPGFYKCWESYWHEFAHTGQNFFTKHNILQNKERYSLWRDTLSGFFLRTIPGNAGVDASLGYIPKIS